jgi:hypothetical protein
MMYTYKAILPYVRIAHILTQLNSVITISLGCIRGNQYIRVHHHQIMSLGCERLMDSYA